MEWIGIAHKIWRLCPCLRSTWMLEGAVLHLQPWPWRRSFSSIRCSGTGWYLPYFHIVRSTQVDRRISLNFFAILVGLRADRLLYFPQCNGVTLSPVMSRLTAATIDLGDMPWQQSDEPAQDQSSCPPF